MAAASKSLATFALAIVSHTKAMASTACFVAKIVKQNKEILARSQSLLRTPFHHQVLICLSRNLVIEAMTKD